MRINYNDDRSTREHLDEGPEERCWVAPDDMASEEETGHLLWAIARMVKPLVVLETGCYKGDTTRRIGQALLANNYGTLFTCDSDPQRVAETKLRVMGLPVNVRQMTGLELISVCGNIGMAFIDAGNDPNRTAEIKAIATRLAPGAILILHDARRQPFYDTCAAFPEWQVISIDSPRGLAIWQTPK